MENPILRNRRLNRRIFHKRMCPVCSKYRFDEVGKYEICPLCGWEDDPVSRKDPDFIGGANKMSLKEARRIYNEKAQEEIK